MVLELAESTMTSRLMKAEGTVHWGSTGGSMRPERRVNVV